mmetsp:Transcript_8850/g.25517  ORF Transcript_8850/g.25517 Transcript_8850/m.25517 type:complete len:282 (-) Transcript_8850:212-1057(-)
MGTSTDSAESDILALCRKHPEGLSEDVLQKELTGVPVATQAGAINALLKKHKLQIFKNNEGNLVYKEVVSTDAVKFKGLGSEEMLVYQLIQHSGNTGMWTKDMKFHSNLQQPQITKILKTLESRKLVKSVKSVTGGNRKVYMLYELEPSRELTGGAWYTAHEFDSEFIEALREACFRYIEQQGDATLAEVATFIQSRGFSKVDLRQDDVLSVVNTLVYDGRVETVDDEEDVEHFRPAMLAIPKQSAFTSMPCGVCPVFSQCTPDGPISPANCMYFDKWLDF